MVREFESLTFRYTAGAEEYEKESSNQWWLSGPENRAVGNADEGSIPLLSVDGRQTGRPRDECPFSGEACRAFCRPARTPTQRQARFCFLCGRMVRQPVVTREIAGSIPAAGVRAVTQPPSAVSK